MTTRSWFACQGVWVCLASALWLAHAWADGIPQRAPDEEVARALRQHIGEMVAVKPNTNPEKAVLSEVIFKGPPLGANGSMKRGLVFTAPERGGELLMAFIPPAAKEQRIAWDIVAEQGSVRAFDADSTQQLKLAKDIPLIGAKGTLAFVQRYFRSELTPGHRYMILFESPGHDLRSIYVSLNVFEEEDLSCQRVFPWLCRDRNIPEVSPPNLHDSSDATKNIDALSD